MCSCKIPPTAKETADVHCHAAANTIAHMDVLLADMDVPLADMDVPLVNHSCSSSSMSHCSTLFQHGHSRPTPAQLQITGHCHGAPNVLHPACLLHERLRLQSTAFDGQKVISNWTDLSAKLIRVEADSQLLPTTHQSRCSRDSALLSRDVLADLPAPR